jgi:hypothetical protein
VSSRSQSLWAALIALGAAAAWAQDASRGAGDDYRLRVVEPTEGLGVTGSSLRVTVELDARPRVGDGSPAARATPTSPPRIDLLLDGDPRGAMPRDQKTVVIEGLGPGAHTLLVTATDASDAVVDRKEVHFTVLPPPPS